MIVVATSELIFIIRQFIDFWDPDESEYRNMKVT